MLKDRALILAKVETTYGTDAAPTAAADAILSSAPNIEVLGGRRERNVALPWYGKLAPTNVGEGIKLSFQVELRGAGALPDTPPRIGALLRACNFTETIDSTPGAENTTYAPNSSESGESATIYFYRDGLLHKVLGCVGTFKLAAKVNEVATVDFEFTGLYAGDAGASDAAFPTPTFGDAASPMIFRSASFTVHGYSAVVDALNVDIGNVIARRVNANASTGIDRHWISGRDVKGDCDPEAVALSTFNPWNLWDQSTPGALSATIGQATQNRCVVSLPNIVPDIPGYGDREGRLTYAYPFTAHPTAAAGNNEISLKFD